MKKNLLLAASLIVGATSFAQFDQSNEPSLGDGTTLYIIDSMAPDMAAETGASATWDYSSYGGYGGESRTLTMLDPASTSYQSDYAASTKVLDVQGFIKTFFSSDASERVSQGFVYTDPDVGEVVVKFSTDEAIQYQYPFVLNDNFTDAFEGTATYDLGGTQTSPATGTLTASVDGTGTLELADGTSYTGVTRYKLEETTEVATGGFLGTVILNRTQYEYYDLANEKLPVFVHTYVKLTGGGSTMTEFDLVMSAEDPAYVLDVEENNILVETRVYPNPASEEINVILPNNVDAAAISIVDAVGREVYSGSIDAMSQKVNVSSLNEGMYFVTISNGDMTATKTVVIK